MHEPQEKQSGFANFCLFSIAVIEVFGHSFVQSLQSMHVSRFTFILNILKFSKIQPVNPNGHTKWQNGL